MASSASSQGGNAIIMFLPLLLIVFAAVVVALAGRTKRMKCPDCGNVFDAPSTDQKRSGSGWTLPYMGTVKCPKCGASRPRRGYPKAPALPKKAA